MKIPKSFTLFGNTVTVREVDRDEDNRYGYWNDGKEEIVVAHKVKIDGELITLTQTQINGTFLHELIHAMQWYSKGTYDEFEAQSYSNLLMEFIKSSGIKIDPNLVHESVKDICNE